MRSTTLPLLVGLMLLPTAIVQGQAAPAVPVEKPQGVFVPADRPTRLADKPQGWSYGLVLSANANITSNKDVVGQLDGNSFLLGASILTNVGYLRGPHEWLNTGSLNEAWSKTPTLERWVKSNDLLDLQSLYNYFINEYTGPFARVQLATTILKTDRVVPERVTYVNADDPTDRRPNATVLRLSDAFQPFTLSESVGWFVQPIRSDRLNVFGRAGFGGRHTWADGARAIDDDEDTPAVEFKVLKDVHQGGAELFAGVDGKEVEGRLLYSLGLTALFPFFSNDDTNRSIAKLARVQLLGAVGIGVFSWMSVNYQLKVLRDVQLVDAIQVQNALLLSFQYAVSSPKPVTKPAPLPPEAEEKISELEARAAAAEERAVAAEARAREAEISTQPPVVAPEAPAPAPAPPAPPTAP